MSIARHGRVENSEGDAIENFNEERVPGVGQEGVEERPETKDSEDQSHGVGVTQCVEYLAGHEEHRDLAHKALDAHIEANE